MKNIYDMEFLIKMSKEECMNFRKLTNNSDHKRLSVLQETGSDGLGRITRTIGVISGAKLKTRVL